MFTIKTFVFSIKLHIYTYIHMVNMKILLLMSFGLSRWDTQVYTLEINNWLDVIEFITI